MAYFQAHKNEINLKKIMTKTTPKIYQETVVAAGPPRAAVVGYSRVCVRLQYLIPPLELIHSHIDPIWIIIANIFPNLTDIDI